MDLRFDETKDALQVRIEAHKKYSSLKIEDVLEELVGKLQGPILDAGCGSGNFTELLAKRAPVYIGIDKGEPLLEKARAAADAAKLRNAVFFAHDFDTPLPFVGPTFDFILFAYSAYYVDDSDALLKRCAQLLTDHGMLCMIGPMAGNGAELDRISEKLMGVPAKPSKDVRAQRLEAEFLPAARKHFGVVEGIRKDFSVRFPSPEEYARYYLATPQYLELAKGAKPPTGAQVVAAIKTLPQTILSKKSIFLVARKPRR